MAECYQLTVEKMIENLNPENGGVVEGKNLHDIEVMANEPTVINLVNLIISEAMRREPATSTWSPSRIRFNCAIVWTGCCRKNRRLRANCTPP